MSQAPKMSIPPAVRESLRRARADSVSHPDANLLSAFAENSLKADERESVMQHMAVCAECRQILAFAVPEEEEAATSVRAQARLRGFSFRWAAARWTALAATAGVLIAAVLLYRVQPSRPTNEVAERANIKTPAPAPQLSAGGSDLEVKQKATRHETKTADQIADKESSSQAQPRGTASDENKLTATLRSDGSAAKRQLKAPAEPWLMAKQRAVPPPIAMRELSQLQPLSSAESAQPARPSAASPNANAAIAENSRAGAANTGLPA